MSVDSSVFQQPIQGEESVSKEMKGQRMIARKLPRSGLVQQLIERQKRRNIQYRGISRLLLQRNTVHLFTIRLPADDQPEGSERPWRTSMEQAKVHVNCAPGPLAIPGQPHALLDSTQ